MAAPICIWFPGTLEMTVILIVGLVLFGGRLPEVGKSIGRSLIEFRKGLRDLRHEAGLDDVTEIRNELRDLTRLPPIEDAELEEDPIYPPLQEEEEQEAGEETDNEETDSKDKSGEAQEW